MGAPELQRRHWIPGGLESVALHRVAGWRIWIRPDYLRRLRGGGEGAMDGVQQRDDSCVVPAIGGGDGGDLSSWSPDRQVGHQCRRTADDILAGSADCSGSNSALGEWR